jgi:hypothetical protein
MNLLRLSRALGMRSDRLVMSCKYSAPLQQVDRTNKNRNELHAVLRRQQNERISSISPNALEQLQEAVGKCDEIIYEVARGVLVAHERMKNVPTIDGLLVLSIQERVQWPLCQMRMSSLIPELSSCKMDIVLHLLVLQIRSERFFGRR